ncbi:MAG: murein biosynthesis integral membrane protein MurJ [Firmicutes bacterium]|nr:murein biosynthesis integral membrane protein MurJ [Bacillota bacterium]
MSRRPRLTTAQLAVFMAVLTLFSKVLSFVREMVLANYFGAGIITDAYVMAQSIPNSLLAAVISAVGISYMPNFSKKLELEGEESANLFTSQLVNLQLLIIAAVVAAGSVFAGPLVNLFAPGFSEEAAALTAWYLRPAFCVLFFTMLAYIFGAWLNYKGIFLPQMVFGILQNVVLIIIVAVSASVDYHLLILGPLFGYGVYGVLHVLWARKNGFRYTPNFSLNEAVSDVLRLAIPVFLGGYVNQINLAIDKMLASGLTTGCVSALNYANQIINSISALTVTIFVTILYPRLNKAFVQGEYERMSSLSERGIRLICVLSVPFSMGLICYASDVIRVIFERGAFDPQATVLTASALSFYSVGLAFLSVNTLITKIYYSMHDTKTAVRCSAVSVLLNIVLNLVLVRYMAHAGLALATSISHMANTVLLVYTFRRRYPQIRLMAAPQALLKLLAISAVSVAGSRLLYGVMGAGLLNLMLCAGLAVLVYLALLWLLRFDEIRLLRDLIARRRAK